MKNEPPKPSLAKDKFRRGDKVRTTFAATRAGYEPQEGVVVYAGYHGGPQAVTVSVNGRRGKTWHMDYWEVTEARYVPPSVKVVKAPKPPKPPSKVRHHLIDHSKFTSRKYFRQST